MTIKNAVLDIGNSVIKLGIIDVNSRTLKSVIECNSLADCQEILTHYDVSQLLYSNVRPDFDGARLNTSGQIQVLDVQDWLPDDTIRFNADLDIGIDRKLACIAAKEMLVQPFVVATFGTATTVSLVNENSCEYSIIWPGLQLSAKAVSENTRIEIESEFPFTGYETVFNHPVNLQDSVVQGVYFSTVLAIENWIGKYEKHLQKSLDVVLTGGNSKLISNQFKSNYLVEPNLVLHSLIKIIDRM